MIAEKDKIVLYILTGFLDIIFLIILALCQLSFYDKGFTILMLFFHGLFYIGLNYNIKQLIDALHYLIFFSLIAAINLSNIYLLSLTLFLAITIKLLWIYEKRCLLGTVDGRGYDNESEVLILFITIILAYKIGKIQ
tara:strand:+ start:28 stop:438 length:411 start_codon:yes stop_codon:yes gene_type:complete